MESVETHLAGQFSAMGARAKLMTISMEPRRAYWDPDAQPLPNGVRVDIQRDGAGEYFDVRRNEGVTVEVLDVRPEDRHLLLQAVSTRRETTDGVAFPSFNSRFLCGHDERAWFVAAIPEAADAQDVQDAKDALKPDAVWDAMRQHAVPMEHRDRRRTAAFIRQGEWFFLPRPTLKVNRRLILRDEPIRRGLGKPHRCQFLYRIAGTPVYIHPNVPEPVSEAEFRELRWKVGAWRWERVFRGARVYVKGNIRHPDHKTVWLSDWHEVVMNTETEAVAMERVAFLD